MITENVSTLKIHKLTKAQYERELTTGTIDQNALYLTPEEELDLSGYATIDQLNEKAKQDDLLALQELVGETDVPTQILNATSDVIRYTEQTLTDEQKTKARANIESLSSSHETATDAHSDIRETISTLKTQVDDLNSDLGVANGIATLDENGLVSEEQSRKEIFWITCTFDDTEGVFAFDKTFAEISAAHEAGKKCMLDYIGFELPLTCFMANNKMDFIAAIGGNEILYATLESDDTVTRCSLITLRTTTDTQAASTITAGTFAGEVAADSSSQTASNYILRNQKLAATEEAPTVNGEICWKYE